MRRPAATRSAGAFSSSRTRKSRSRYRPITPDSPPPRVPDPERYRRKNDAVKSLTDHSHEAPVWIVACLEAGENPGRTAGSSIYGAVQNMCLATRALGLGTTLTTRHTGYGKEVDAIFGLPPGVQ